jgi:hypothetical protein
LREPEQLVAGERHLVDLSVFHVLTAGGDGANPFAILVLELEDVERWLVA